MGSSLTGTNWRILVHHVHLGNKNYRVIQPARVIRGALEAPNEYGFELHVHHEDIAAITQAWLLALRSPYSIVHVPLRGTQLGTDTDIPRERQLDLVLLHHRIGLAPSQWKGIRARIGKGKPQTVKYHPPREEISFDRSWYREYRDHLRCAVQANTVFVTGSRAAFLEDLPELEEFTQQTPPQLTHNPDWHHCAEISLAIRDYCLLRLCAVYYVPHPDGGADDQLYATSCIAPGGYIP